jgi:hypothetical protein
MKSELYARYQSLDDRLTRIRSRHGGRESKEEDKIVEQLADLWWKLTDDERRTLRALPQHSLIKTAERPSVKE